MTSSAVTTVHVGLGPDQLAAAFPFHFVVDQELRIRQAGRSLSRLCPDLLSAESIHSVLRVLRPEHQGTHDFGWMLANRSHLLVLEHVTSGLQLRGQILPTEEGRTLLFLGSPWLTDASQLGRYGLELADFPTHDPVLDLLHVLQAQKIALADGTKLAAKLTAQRAELRAINERLCQQEAEQRKLALVAARTDNAVIVTDARARIEWVNEGFTRITGFTPDEVRGRTPGSFLQGAETDAATIKFMRRAIQRGEGFSTEILNYRKDGRKYWLALEVQPIRNDHGEITNFMAIESDITDRRRDLQRRALQHEVSCCIAAAEALGPGLTAIIEAACRTLGLRLGACWRPAASRTHLCCEEAWHDPQADLAVFIEDTRNRTFARGEGLPGRVWASRVAAWVPDVTSDPHFPRAQSALAAGLRAGVAFPILLRGEVWGIVEFFAATIEEPDRDLIQLFEALGGQIAQFVERRTAESQLRTTIALQRAILESAEYSIISTDPDGTIRTFNRAAEKMLGYASDEVVGQRTPAIIHDRDEVVRRAAELTAELGRPIEPGFEVFIAKARLGTPDEREWSYVRKDGSRFPVLLSVTAQRDDEGRLTGYLGIASDITERKRTAEALIVARDAAEAASRAKSDFLATMSHEIRTPMNGILGMTDLLRQTTLTARQREFAEAVAQSAHALLDVINDVLDFSKLEAGRLSVEPEDFEVRPLLDAVLENASHRAPSKRLLIARVVRHEIPHHLSGDPVRLRQILLNLVGNAVKFTERGEVIVRVTLSERQGNRLRLRFEIRDTGIGLTPEQIARLFQPFVQLDTSSSRRYMGTGLGLAISRRLVELMGGVIGVSSRPGAGSTFWFELPLAPGAVPDDQVQRPSFASVQVLVASDNASLREGLAEQLLTWGVGTTQASSLEELSTALASRPEEPRPRRIILLDENLGPAGAALSTIADVRAGPTHWVLLEQPTAALAGPVRHPFDATLLKPVKQSHLLDCLAAFIEGREIDRVAPAPATFPDAERPAPDRDLAALRLLLVEDQPINRRLCELVLEGLGLRADVAVNGLEAVDALRRQDYDIVLMDCHLPELDGYEATRAIRRAEAERPPTHRHHTHIIALTANALVGERERCLTVGMDDYLTKPFTPRQLQEALQRGLHRPGAVSRRESPSTPTPAPLQATFDASPLQRLCHELGEEGVRTIVAEFVRDLPGQAEHLAALATSGSWQPLALSAHSLLGIGRTLGLDEFAAHLLALEDAARAEATGVISEQVARVSTCARAAVDRLHAWLDSGTDPTDPTAP